MGKKKEMWKIKQSKTRQGGGVLRRRGGRIWKEDDEREEGEK